MKYFLSISLITLLPFSLLAQTKAPVRKAVPAKRPTTTRTIATPTKKNASATKLTVATTQSSPKPSSVVSATTTPAVQEQPAQQPTPVTLVAQSQPNTATTLSETVLPARTKTSKLSLGFRFGGNFSTIGGIDPTEFGEGVSATRVLGYHNGFILNFGGPNFSIQPEILYSQYGIKLKAGADYLQLKYNMLEVPVLFKASFGQPQSRFFINAGPVATYTLNGTISIQESGQSESAKIDMTDQGRLSFGFVGGAGVAIKAGPGTIQLEARYSYLFSSNEDGTNLKPQNAMLSASYLIPLGGQK